MRYSRNYTLIIISGALFLLGVGCAGLFQANSREPGIQPKKIEIATSTTIITSSSTNTTLDVSAIPADWQVYENKELGLRFRYPEGWILKEGRLQDLKLRDGSLDETGKLESAYEITLYISKQASEREAYFINSPPVNEQVEIIINTPYYGIDAGSFSQNYLRGETFDFGSDITNQLSDGEPYVFDVLNIGKNSFLGYIKYTAGGVKGIELVGMFQNNSKSLNNLTIKTYIGDYYKLDFNHPRWQEELPVILNIAPQSIIEQARKQQFHKDFITLYNSTEF